MPHILYVHDLDFNAIPKKRKVNPSKKYFYGKRKIVKP